VTGPLTDTSDYSCTEYFGIHTSINELIGYAKQTMWSPEPREYNWSTNNSKHFSYNILTKYLPYKIKMSVKQSVVTAYVKKYKDDLTSTNLDDDDDDMDKIVAAAKARELGGDLDAEVEKPKAKPKVLTFVEVLKNYPLAST